MRGTVVMLAYYVPPLVGIASERAASLARHLSETGWLPVVVSPEAGFYHRDEASRPPEGVEVVRTGSVELSRIARRIWTGAEERVRGGAVRAVPVGKGGGHMRRWLREYLYVPDAQNGWIPFARRAAARVVRDRASDGPVVVHSSSVPYSAHLAARSVAAAEGVPWVAELRDPWTTCHPSLRPRSALRRAVDRRLESDLLGAADAVVVTSRSTRESLLTAHPALSSRSVHVVMNGFEELVDDLLPTPPGPGEPMSLLYAGTVAPGVDETPLLEAVSAVEGSHPGAIRMHVLGPADSWRRAAASLPGSDRWLESPGLVTPGEARRSMAAASVNVILLPGEPHRDRLPGKLFEYLGVLRPLLAVVPPGSEMEAMARRFGDARIVTDYRTGTVADALGGLLEEHRRGRLQAPRGTPEAVAVLSRRAQAGRLAEILWAVAGKGSGPVGDAPARTGGTDRDGGPRAARGVAPPTAGDTP